MKQKKKRPERRQPTQTGEGQPVAPAATVPPGSSHKLAWGTSRTRLAAVPPLVWVLALLFLGLVCFIDKPFFIDDTLFLRAAEQIQKHPGDFYGFEMNWFRTNQPMLEVFENPPLASYYLALAASLVGWSEPALHLAFLVPALAAAWGIFSLARVYCGHPAWAALLAVSTPVFFVSATSVMCDVMLLAFWVWTVVAFEKGLKNNSRSAFAAAGLLGGLAYLTKFSGLAVVPLLTAYGLVRRRRPGWWLLALTLPLLFAGGYEWLTFKLYGHGHLQFAATYAHQEGARLALGARLLVGLCFAGGCFLPFLFYTPWLWTGRVLCVYLVLACAGVLILPHVPVFATWLQRSETVNWIPALQAGIFTLGGIHLICLAAADGWQQRDSVSLLLALWVAGIFVFAIAFNWVVNARSFLPAAPALVILAVRRLERHWRDREISSPRLLALAAVPAVALSLLLARADCQVAQSARTAARDLYAKYEAPGRVVWFEGHWGFQYYMEKLGAKPLDMVNPKVGPNDVLIIPNAAPGVSRPAPSVAVPIDAVSYRPNRYWSTMSPASGASFYASSWGPLPYVFGQLKAEHYIVFRPVPR